MTWWQSSTGSELSGSDEDSFASGFGVIPNNTTARAVLKKIEIEDYNGESFIQCQWKIIEGPFKDQVTRQKIHVYDTKPQKADRARNMLVRLYKIAATALPTTAPTDKDLSMLQGKIVGIRVLEYWTDEGKNGNWVSEIHAPTADFVCKVGEKLPSPPQKLSVKQASDAFFNPSQSAAPMIDDEIPF